MIVPDLQNSKLLSPKRVHVNARCIHAVGTNVCITRLHSNLRRARPFGYATVHAPYKTSKSPPSLKTYDACARCPAHALCALLFLCFSRPLPAVAWHDSQSIHIATDADCQSWRVRARKLALCRETGACVDLRAFSHSFGQVGFLLLCCVATPPLCFFKPLSFGFWVQLDCDLCILTMV